jgi:HK97 family phage major capsid protein
MSAEVNDAIKALNKTFADFKAANDERINNVAKGFDDVIKKEEVDRINNAIDDAMDRLKAVENAANRPALAGSGEQEKNIKQDAREFFAGVNKVEDYKVNDTDLETYRNYSEAFNVFLTKSNAMDKPDIRATLSVGSDPDGGYFVPTVMSNDIKKRLFETSPVRQVASSITITTDSIEYPIDAESGSSGGWTDETTAPSTTGTPKVGTQKIYVYEQYAQPRATQRLLDMATINIESWLNGKIVDIMSRAENTAFVTGNGVGKPRGFLDYGTTSLTTTDKAGRAWGKLQYIPSGAAGGLPDVSGITGAVDMDAIFEIIAALNPVYRAGAIFAMNRQVEKFFRTRKDADGRYLVDLNVTQGATGFNLGGYNIVTMEDMPDLAGNSFSLAFGNFRTAYQIVDGRGFRVLRDPFTDKPFVKFYTTKYTGGDVVNFDALKLMKFATT